LAAKRAAAIPTPLIDPKRRVLFLID